QADSNSDARNTIMLATGNYALSNAANGELLIHNTSALPSKTLTIAGTGANTFIGAGAGWGTRIFEIVGSTTTVTFQNLVIRHGNAIDGGQLGGSAALGGGMLIEGSSVSLNQVRVDGTATGSAGTVGTAGSGTGTGGPGSPGGDAYGGGIYLASGTLAVSNN